VVGAYVLAESESARAWPSQDAHARRKLVGRVTDVVDGKLLVQSREGEVKLDAARMWIESNLANFQTVLRKACGRSFERDLVALEGKIAAFNYAERRIADTDKIANALLDRGPLDVAAGMTAHLARPLRLKGNQHPHVRTLSEPTFVFDQSGDKTDLYPEAGLNKFGPFDTESFTPKAPTIAVVVPRQFQGRVETFLTRFRDGVRGSKAFPEGFVRKFRLTDCTFTLTVFDGDVQDTSAYKRACLSALEAKEKIDLAFVFTSAAQEHLTGNESPYLVSKSTFMSQSIAVQEFQVENITDNPSIAYPLSTMALAVYAKLGGTPFAIKDNGQPTRRELIFGIGSAQVFEDRLGKGERVVGITTVFNSDGTYLVSNVSREAPYEQYPNALQDALRACLTEIKGRQGWKSNDFIRLVFHVFKLLKDEEAQAIKELVEGLTADFAGVEFAFVTVVDDHPWMILDENARGVSAGKGSKGKYVARRGFAVLVHGLEGLAGRDPYPGDRVTPLYSAGIVLGLHLAARAVQDRVPRFLSWLQKALNHPMREPNDPWLDLMHQHVLAELTGEPASLPALAGLADHALVAAFYLLASGTGVARDTPEELRAAQQRAMHAFLRTDPADLEVRHAALWLNFAEAVATASADQLVISVPQVSQVLRRFPPAMKRWVWDSAELKDPKWWRVDAEREVQAILWVMLRAVFDRFHAVADMI
jgi:hypothetical protein